MQSHGWINTHQSRQRRRDTLHIWSVVALTLLLTFSTQNTLAQATKEPVDLDVALAALRAAYSGADPSIETLTGGTIEERVEVVVRRTGSSWRETFVVRLQQGAGSRRKPSCRLELGETIAYWTKAKNDVNELIAIHERSADVYFARTIHGDLDTKKLSEGMLPVPSPQLVLAFDRTAAEGRTMRWLTPYTPSITWNDATKEPRRNPGEIVVTGSCDALTPPAPGSPPIAPGAAFITIDETTGRLKRFFAEIDGGKLELELRVRPEKSLPRDQWVISTTGRTKVEAMSDLAPRKGDAATAKAWPDIVVQDTKGRVWVPREGFATPVGNGADAGAPDMLAVLFVRETERRQADANRGIFDKPAARVAVDALRRWSADRAIAPDAATMPRIALQVVLVLDTPDGRAMEKIERGTAEWGAGVVWCSSPSSSIDRFIPGGTHARAAMVFLKPDASVCNILVIEPLDDSKEATAEFERKLRAAISCDPAPANGKIPE